MKEFEFKYEKIKEEDLDIKVSIRHNNIPNSYSLEKIRICNVHLTHTPTGLTCNVDSDTGIDTGYKYALKELEKKYTKLIRKKKITNLQQQR